MQEVGIRELKQNTSKILRRVRERRESVTITHRGKPVAQLVPLADPDEIRAQGLSVLARIDELATEISAHWPAGVTAEEAVREQRREL